MRIIKPENPDRVFAFYFNVNHDPRANDHVVVDAGMNAQLGGYGTKTTNHGLSSAGDA